MSEAPRAGLTRFVARGGHRLSYEVHGDRAGRPLLGLHDLLADRGQLRPLATAQESTGFLVILPDARGHGASPTISGRRYATAELVDDTLTILDAEAIDATSIVAVGWSAATALLFAAREPARVRSLVVVEPYLPALLAAHGVGSDRETGAAHWATLEAAAAAGERGQLDRALELLLGERVNHDWRARMPKARQAAARRNAVNLAPLLTGFLATPLTPEHLMAIDVAVTIVLPEHASPIVQMTGNWLASVMPRVSVEMANPEPGESGPRNGEARLAAIILAVTSARG